MSSGDGVKEYGSPMFPHLEFLGWTSEEVIQSFINRIKDQMLDEDSKQRIDHLIPPEAVSMMYKRLTGRFRPCVTAEGIISTNDSSKWEEIINNTELLKQADEWCDKLVAGKSRVDANSTNDMDKMKSMKDPPIMQGKGRPRSVSSHGPTSTSSYKKRRSESKPDQGLNVQRPDTRSRKRVKIEPGLEKPEKKIRYSTRSQNKV
ncbi:hypothetical protein BGZ76_004033 [Entomortierella beljakovae]|nr:hypothetical protein BGZ76_004033 [Entomortierella beljakovae]